MADRYAVADGLWSDPATWDGGSAVPTYGGGDDVYANGFVVTIDETIYVNTLLTTDLGATLTPGGYFVARCVDNLIISFAAGLDAANLDPTGAVQVDPYGRTLLHVTSVDGDGSLTIVGSLTGGLTDVDLYSAICAVLFESSEPCQLYVAGNLYGGPGNGAAILNYYGSISVTGDMYGGSGSSGTPGVAIMSYGGLAPVTVAGTIYGPDSSAFDPDSYYDVHGANIGGGSFRINHPLVHGTTDRDFALYFGYGAAEGWSSMTAAEIQALVSPDDGWPGEDPYTTVTDIGDGQVRMQYTGAAFGGLEAMLARGLLLESVFIDPSTVITSTQNVTATVVEADQVAVTWEAPLFQVEEILTYEVQWSTTEIFTVVAGSRTVAGDLTGTTIPEIGPMDPGDWYVRVRGLGATVTGLWGGFPMVHIAGISGWLTVTAQGILGLADTADSDMAPDYVPVIGSVTLTPGINRPLRLIAEGEFLMLSGATGVFNADGKLEFDGQDNVRIVAPLWTNLSNTDWRWTADVRPGVGQSWNGFSVSFTGNPGDVINLATLL